MKSYLVKSVFLVTTAFLFIMVQACNQSENKKNQEQAEQHDEVHSHDDNHTADRLALNNGEKWSADEPTNKNAEIIISIGAQFLEHDNKTLGDYQVFGDDVNEAINTMIRECTMKGEADMALHNWFAPLMQNANTLKQSTDTKGLSDIALKMVDRMQMYHEYFE